jgi:hypothetical protein
LDAAEHGEDARKTRAQRVAESYELAPMLHALNELPMPVIGRVNGPADGGGVGMKSKRLISYVHSHDLPTSMTYAADKLADAWETEEGRAGIEAFFARHPPPWRQ